MFKLLYGLCVYFRNKSTRFRALASELSAILILYLAFIAPTFICTHFVHGEILGILMKGAIIACPQMTMTKKIAACVDVQEMTVHWVDRQRKIANNNNNNKVNIETYFSFLVSVWFVCILMYLYLNKILFTLSMLR